MPRTVPYAHMPVELYRVRVRVFVLTTHTCVRDVLYRVRVFVQCTYVNIVNILYNEQ